MTAEASGLGADSSEDEILPNKSSQLNADSSEDEIKTSGSQLNADSSDEDVPTRRPSNINANSSDDGEISESRDKALQSSDDEEVSQTVSRRKGKKKTFITSDGSDTEEQNEVTERKNASSSEEETAPSSPGGRKKKKITMRKAVRSDEDSDEDQSQSKSGVSTLLKNKDLYDAESSEDELPDIPRYSRQEESDGSGSEGEVEEESLDAIKNKVVEKHKKGSERKSAQAAMMEIRSESARMTRESAIGLPYHRPKQRSLDEFLNRKKGTPEVFKSINLKRLDSNIDKVMEERENKIKEFFKNDSEEENAADDEEDEEDKDYNPNAPEDSETAMEVHAERPTELPQPEVSTEATSEDSMKEDKEEVAPSSPGTQITPEFPDQGEKEPIDTNESGDSLRLELDPETEVMEVAAPAEEESLKLVLETESLGLTGVEEDVIPASPVSKPVSKAWARLQALKNKLGDSSNLEDTLQVTPKIGTNPDNEELVICEAGSEKNVSKGAQKLIDKFISHAKAGSDRSAAVTPEVENVKIVSKKTVDGKEVLMEEIVEYKKNESSQKKLFAGSSYTTYKAKLKKEMMAKKRAEVEQKRELMKMNNEEGFEDELPEDEVAEDEEYEYDDEEEEGESEPEEEDDVVYKDKKRKKSNYIDDEAEDEDEDDDEAGDEDDEEAEDDESDENESVTFEESSLKKTQFRKIIQDPELMSETSNQSDSVFGRLERIRCDTETPTLNQSGKQTSAPSSNSSFGAFVLAEPRWTPFQDRTNHLSMAETDNTLSVSPTQSQLAKKKLGFEGLFDATDPDVTGIDDVIGLCSGQFATQSQAPGQTQAGLETQDTVILSGAGDSRPVSRAQSPLDTQGDTVIVSGTQADLQLNASINNILQDLDKDEENVGHGVIESDEEEDQPEAAQMLKVSKKRKGRLLSDSEESDNEDHTEDKEEEGENAEAGERDYDSEENEISKPKAVKQKLFTKKGKLRHDFYDIEAELSDEEGGELEVSDDEDEKDLDRLEMEDGDMDDIDENEEMEKVGRIHQRVLLDEDQANLKLFQERFLEDGDLHTDYKRQRQFKWNGLDEDIEVHVIMKDRFQEFQYFFFVSQVGPRKDEEANGEEEETLEQWRLAKMEKEKWMQVESLK